MIWEAVFWAVVLSLTQIKLFSIFTHSIHLLFSLTGNWWYLQGWAYHSLGDGAEMKERSQPREVWGKTAWTRRPLRPGIWRRGLTDEGDSL